jgi:cytochrome P450
VYPSLDGALPIVGHLPEMYRRFPELCARGQAALGPLFWIHGGPGAQQLMCTHAGALGVLNQRAASTSFYAEGFEALLSNTLFAFDGSEHRRVRGVMAPAFSPARVRRTNVLAIVADAASAHVARWIDAGGVEVLSGTRELALEIIFRIIGVADADLSAWRRQFSRYMLAGLPSRGRFRGPLHWLGRRGRDWLDARLGAIVDSLRARDDATTLVGAIANSRDEHGELLDRALIVANLRLLVLAGHETTASAIAWNLLHLADRRDHQERAVDEAARSDDGAAIATGEPLSFAEAQFREALRLYPAVHSVIRRVTSDLELEVGRVASGTLLNVPLVHLLRDPERFSDPERHRPERWTRRPAPGSIETAMFGGGPHFCLGYHVAMAEGTLVNLVLAQSMGRRGVRLRRARAGPLPAPIYLPLSHPPRGHTVLFEKNA